MKEVSNYAQNDNVAVVTEKYSDSMGNLAAGIWKDEVSALATKKMIDAGAVKCFGLSDLKIDGLENITKGGCTTSSIENDSKPGKPVVKPEKPADGGLKDPVKETTKVPGQDGGIKKPFKPDSGATIEFGEPFVKPVPKPGKEIKSSADIKTLE